jgi:hypothetical protein
MRPRRSKPIYSLLYTYYGIGDAPLSSDYSPLVIFHFYEVVVNA